ncbi:MAG: virulence RhuM family protein [Brevinemataceae bacterium]
MDELNNNEPKHGEIILYQTEDGKNKIDVTVLDETVWLTQNQMAELFQTSKQNISLHIKNILEENELSEKSTVKYYLTVQTEGFREVSREIAYYNLDMIIAIGYRVRSNRGTQFRQWATDKLKEYLIKGFTMNDDLLKNGSKSNYFDELLARIRDIRSSEKVFYSKVLDIFSTSVDYDKDSEICREFFKTVQNKFHYAVHGHTASELIFERCDSTKINMGLTNFKGDKVTKKDAQIAKNYLNRDELERLNRLVTLYLEFAEFQTLHRNALYMKDHVDKVNEILTMTNSQILKDAGKISHEKAIEKSVQEYNIYRNQLKDLSKAEKDMLKQLDQTAKQLEKKNKSLSS